MKSLVRIHFEDRQQDLLYFDVQFDYDKNEGLIVDCNAHSNVFATGKGYVNTKHLKRGKGVLLVTTDIQKARRNKSCDPFRYKVIKCEVLEVSIAVKQATRELAA